MSSLLFLSLLIKSGDLVIGLKRKSRYFKFFKSITGFGMNLNSLDLKINSLRLIKFLNESGNVFNLLEPKPSFSNFTPDWISYK